jgi:hypothetical protein
MILWRRVGIPSRENNMFRDIRRRAKSWDPLLTTTEAGKREKNKMLDANATTNHMLGYVQR